MDPANDDDLEVATVLAKGLGQGLGSGNSRKVSSSSGHHSEQSPRRSSTFLTNNSRGNTATVTPSHAINDSIHQLAARGELIDLQHMLDDNEVDELDDEGLTPLMWASMYGQAEVVTYLLSIGANPDLSDQSGVTPTMMACHYGHVDVVKTLVESKVHIDNTDEDGNTALLYSVIGNNPECVTVLLGKGADLTIKNNQDYSAMDTAIKLQHKQVQKAIELHLLRTLEFS